MEIILSGYNIDSDIIKELAEQSSPRNDITPETLSAAYARISRDPRPINELRAQARKEVARSRKSNKAIIFKMGHHSVAEHAVFNFDIIGVSRLAMEEIEHFRLCSYTEKSQRYITLGNDFVLPREIKNSGDRDLFRATVEAQNDLYHLLHTKIYQYIRDRDPGSVDNPNKINLIDGKAKEDARYITCLAAQGQVGLTINARNLELLLRRFAGHPLSEIREIGKRLWQLVKDVAPSIILFYNSNDYDMKTYADLRATVAGGDIGEPAKTAGDDVRLAAYTEDADNMLLAALVHSSSNLDFEQCLRAVRGWDSGRKRELIKTACRRMEFYDSVLREFENINLTYDLIVSASCFAQMKRHRMAVITGQTYDLGLGVTIPKTIQEVGMKDQFTCIIKKTEDAYLKIAAFAPKAASYILTNGHRKRILFTCNVRELYHISRQREDLHAQWDIRQVAGKMIDLAKKIMPLTMMLAGGKDRYPGIYEEVYGDLPKIIETGG